jgi:N-acetylglucosamine-6-phosphate deacetylase
VLFLTAITTETISDGIHISYPALRIAYKQKGTDNVLLISDAMMACCMPNGEYSLGGQKVLVNDDEARLENGALAGSVLTLDKSVRNVYKNSNLPLHEIVKMASYNGAKHCKVNNHKGQIKEGFDADLILFDDNINIKKVFVLGEEVYSL